MFDAVSKAGISHFRAYVSSGHLRTQRSLVYRRCVPISLQKSFCTRHQFIFAVHAIFVLKMWGGSHRLTIN